MFVASEGIEALGGVGYLEPSGMPRLFRDMQVAPVWEGTTNILSLDIWRALGKDKSLSIFISDVKSKLSPSTSHVVRTLVLSACDNLVAFAARCEKDTHLLETSARHFAYNLSKLYIAALFADHSSFTKDPVDEECAVRWAQRSLYVTAGSYDAKYQEMSKRIAKL